MPRGIARNHADKRQALRKGAARFFAEQGFDRASMGRVAQACGVSKALMYHYYDSKEALLYDILDGHLSALEAAVSACAPRDVPTLINAVLQAYEHADAEHKLQLEALSALPSDLQAPLVHTQRRIVGIMSEAILGERPDLSADALRAATMTVFGILNWFYMWHRPGKGLTRAEYAALATRFVRGGLSAV